MNIESMQSSSNSERQPRSASTKSAGRRHGDRVIRQIMGCFALLAVIGLVTDFMLQPHRFTVENIEVEGELENAHLGEVRDIVTSNLQGNFFLMDLAAAANAVENLPMVDDAIVRRNWPSTIEVQVHRKTFVARWADGRWVDSVGGLFEVHDFDDPSLPVFRGPERAAPALIRNYHRWSDFLYGTGVYIKAVSTSGRGSWEVIVQPQEPALATADGDVLRESDTNDAIQVVLGRANPAAEIKRFAEVYGSALAAVSSELKRVDMRHRDGVAILWHDDVPKIAESVKIKLTRT